MYTHISRVLEWTLCIEKFLRVKKSKLTICLYRGVALSFLGDHRLVRKAAWPQYFNWSVTLWCVWTGVCSHRSLHMSLYVNKQEMQLVFIDTCTVLEFIKCIALNNHPHLPTQVTQKIRTSQSLCPLVSWSPHSFIPSFWTYRDVHQWCNGGKWRVKTKCATLTRLLGK